MAGSPKEFAVASGRGATVAVRDHGGQGQAVMLAHGAGLNLALWDGLVAALSPTYRVVTVDFLGHGASTLPGAYSLHADLAAVEAVSETLGLHAPALVGHSYGGILAVEYAATHPECPLVINLDGLGGQGRTDHYPGLPADEVRDYWAARLAFIDAFVPDDDRGDDAWRDVKIAETLAQATGVDERLARELTERGFQPGETAWERRPPRRFLLNLLHTVFELDVFAAYHRARCPVLVVVASSAREEQAEFARYLDAYHRGLADAVAGNPLVAMTTVEAGHNVPLEQPAWIAGAIEQALGRVSAAAPSGPSE